MDNQEDLIKKQEEERKQAQESQESLSKKMLEDHRKQSEDIQRQQDLMQETQQRHQEALNQAVMDSLRVQSEQRELMEKGHLKPEDQEQGNALDAHRERMTQAADKCHEIANETQEVAKQIRDNQEAQQKLASVIDKPDAEDKLRTYAESRLEKTTQEGLELQGNYDKLSKEFDQQSKLFDAYEKGFKQEHEGQQKLVNEAQERLQAEQQRLAQKQLDEQNNQLKNVADDLEKREAETLGAKWESPDKFDEQGKKLDKEPNGQQFEDQLEKTGKLNERLVEIEKRHDAHHPYQEGEQQKAGTIGVDQSPTKSLVEDEVKLGQQSVGDRDGRPVQPPSKLDAQVNKVQDNWSQHEQQQRQLIKEIRGHEKDKAELKKELTESIKEHGDFSTKKPDPGASAEEVKAFQALKKQQEDLANKINQADNLGKRKVDEFKRNEMDFQQKSWDRVGKMAELSGDKDLQQKAELKSEQLKNKVEMVDQRLDQKYGPKPASNNYNDEDVKIMSEGEVNNKLKPVSPAGISDELVKKVGEQKQILEDRGEARRLDQEQHRIKQGKLQ